jgi:cytochrome c peroxidase
MRKRLKTGSLVLLAIAIAGLVAFAFAPDEVGEERAVDPHARVGTLEAGRLDRVLRATEAASASETETQLVARGERLFRSTDLVKRGESCNTCHTAGGANPDLGVIRHPVEPDDFTGPRDAPALWGAGRTAPYGWTGETDSLEEFVAGTIVSHFEDEDPTPERVAALTAYLESLDPPTTSFDLGTMSAAAQRGQELFQGKGGCVGCHGGPLFTDNDLHALGVPQAAGDQDPGAPNPPGAFNTPTLRDIANTAPYMHNGRLGTLREVVEFYNRESTVSPLELTEREIDDLVEYLKSL